MTDDSLRGLVEQQLGSVSLELHEGITSGFTAAQAMWKRFEEAEYRWLLSMNARARMREHWEETLSVLGWTVSGNVKLMGQTILVSPDERLTLRLLKEHPRVYPGGVPHAGHTGARQEAWSQDPLPGIGTAVGADLVARTTECLLLWDCDWEEGQPALSARVVHTIGPGRYGVRVPIDLSFKIDDGGHLENQAFPGATQLDVLFPNIKQKDNEEDASGQ